MEGTLGAKQQGRVGGALNGDTRLVSSGNSFLTSYEGTKSVVFSNRRRSFSSWLIPAALRTVHAAAPDQDVRSFRINDATLHLHTTRKQNIPLYSPKTGLLIVCHRPNQPVPDSGIPAGAPPTRHRDLMFTDNQPSQCCCEPGMTHNRIGGKPLTFKGGNPSLNSFALARSMTDPRVDEETPLLFSPDDTSVTTFGGSDEVATPLPKLQIGALLSVLLAEPICSQSISPFINQVNRRYDHTRCTPNGLPAHQRARYHRRRRQKVGILCRWVTATNMQSTLSTLTFVLGIIVSPHPTILVEGTYDLLDCFILHLGSILHFHVEQTLGLRWSKAGTDDGEWYRDSSLRSMIWIITLQGMAGLIISMTGFGLSKTFTALVVRYSRETLPI